MFYSGRIEISRSYLWGRRIPFTFQVNYCSIAHNAGLRTKDYIVEVNGSQVFGMNHDDCKNLIKRAGDHVVLRVERGDFIVPNMDEAFPKKKTEQATTVSEPDGSEPQVPT